MKKTIGIILTCLALISFSFVLPSNQTSATTINDKITTQDNEISASRYVEWTMEYGGKIVPETYYYSDSLGYKGYIPIVYRKYYRVLDYTQVKYGGIVCCEGLCPLQN